MSQLPLIKNKNCECKCILKDQNVNLFTIYLGKATYSQVFTTLYMNLSSRRRYIKMKHLIYFKVDLPQYNCGNNLGIFSVCNEFAHELNFYNET